MLSDFKINDKIRLTLCQLIDPSQRGYLSICPMQLLSAAAMNADLELLLGVVERLQSPKCLTSAASPGQDFRSFYSTLKFLDQIWQFLLSFLLKGSWSFTL